MWLCRIWIFDVGFLTHNLECNRWQLFLLILFSNEEQLGMVAFFISSNENCSFLEPMYLQKYPKRGQQNNLYIFNEIIASIN